MLFAAYIPISQAIIAVWLLLAFRVLLDIVVSKKRRLPFAPGPKPLPIVGNMYDMPVSNHGITYMRWTKQYDSDILHASVLGKHYLILNSLEDAEELLERRACSYSDRPDDPILRMIGWTANMAFMFLGNLWRRHRRVAQQHFRLDATIEYQHIQREKVGNMLRGLLETPERFEDHNKMLSVSIPMSMMYGHNLESLEDPFVVAADENATMAFRLLQPGFTLIGLFHFLRYIPPWLPGAVSQRMAQETRHLTDFLLTKPLENVKRQLKEGTAAQSIVAKHLEKYGGSVEEEKLIGDLAFTTYVAAADTTVSATSTLFYSLATNPDIQRKAQAEIDAVVGNGRLPDFGDRATMPYIEAIYREVLRLRPPLPQLIFHQSSEDDVYRDYYIPRGTAVIPNVWAMARDERKYKDPYTFSPDRYFDVEGKLNGDDRVLAFGFGRRICVGKHVASATMWLTIASIIATFSVGKSKDNQGREIEISGEYDEVGLVTRIKPFQCSILPRSEAAKRLILYSTTDI